MSLILALEECKSVPQVGLKAAALGQLVRSGIPVPPGFCLTTEAYRRMIAPLESRILARASLEAVSDPQDIEQAATDIRSWIEGASWPPDLADSFGMAVEELGKSDPSVLSSSFAVRTSMTTEELASAFGSGVKRAHLGPAGIEELKKAVGISWGTPYTSRSLYYRQRKKLRQTSTELGVLVQRLVKAVAGGVMFTSNPMDRLTDHAVIDSVWGLGEPVTSARVAPDRFIVLKSTGAVESDHLTEKTVRMSIAPDGGTLQEAVPELEVARPSLEQPDIKNLVSLGREIEGLLQGPQEIEWCLAAGNIFILQARPIGQRR